MTKLPSVEVESIFLSDGFFNFSGEDGEMGTEEAAKEFIDLFGLTGQVTVEALVNDFWSRT